MNEKKLAICVPTFGRPAVIKEMLGFKLTLYRSLNIDLYIYDSNIDDETKKVTESYQSEFDNLFYVRLPSEMHSNMKVYQIYQKYGWAKSYDYIWVCQDALRFSKALLIKVIDAIANANMYDIIVVHNIARYCSAREYTDKNCFFLDCVWQMTLYGSTILNTDTMLNGVKWEYLTNKYNVVDKVNFSHIGFYFEHIATINHFKACRLDVDPYDITVSSLRNVSGWISDTFLIWLNYWVKAIESLPDFYENKGQAIKKHGRYGGVLNMGNLIALRERGLLNKKIYNEYKNDWANYSGQSKISFFICGVAPTFVLTMYKIKYAAKYIKRMIGILKLILFCKRNKNIYIYGTGQVAKRYRRYLNKWGITITAFIISDVAMQKELCFHGYPIISCSSLPDDGSVGLVLGLNPVNIKDALACLYDCRYSGNLFSVFIP